MGTKQNDMKLTFRFTFNLSSCSKGHTRKGNEHKTNVN